MTTKTEIDALTAQAETIKAEVQALEAEASALDYAGDPGAAVERLEAIEAGLQARRRALAAFRGKIATAHQAAEVERLAALAKQAAGLIEKRDDLTRKIIDELRALRTDLDGLEAIKGELMNYSQHSPAVFGTDLNHAINFVLDERSFFYRDLFDLPPLVKFDRIADAKEKAKNAKAAYEDLKRRQGKFGRDAHIQHADVERAHERYDRALAHLNKLAGLPDIPAADEPSEEEAASILSDITGVWKQKTADIQKAGGRN